MSLIFIKLNQRAFEVPSLSKGYNHARSKREFHSVVHLQQVLTQQSCQGGDQRTFPSNTKSSQEQKEITVLQTHLHREHKSAKLLSEGTRSKQPKMCQIRNRRTCSCTELKRACKCHERPKGVQNFQNRYQIQEPKKGQTLIDCLRADYVHGRYD